MIQIADNIGYLGSKPNFDRDYFLTCELMKAITDDQIDDGHISYCAETKTHYEYNYDNPVDPRLGKWREFKPIDIALDPESTNPIQNKSLWLLWTKLNSSFETVRKEVEAISSRQMDGKLDPESENGVQNKVLWTQFDILGNQIASVSNALKEYVGPHEMLDHVDEESIYPVQSRVLFAKFKEISDTLSDLQSQIDNLDFDLGELKEELEGEIQEMKSEIEDMITEAVKAHVEDITSLREDVYSLVDDAIADHIEDVLGIEAEMGRVEDKLDAAIETHNQDIQDLELKHTDLKARVDKVEPLDTELLPDSPRPVENQVIAAAFKTVEDREINIEGKLEEAKTELKETIETGDSEIKEIIEETREDLTQQIGGVDSKIDELGEKVSGDLDNTLTEISSQLEGIDEKIDSKALEIGNSLRLIDAKVEAGFEDTEESLRGIDEGIKELGDKVEDIVETQLESVSSQLTQLSQDLGDGKDEVIEKLERISDKVVEVESEVIIVSGQVSEVKKQVEGVDKKIDEASGRLELIEYLLVPVTIDFTPDIPIIPLSKSTKVTLSWKCERMGMDVTDDCKFMLDGEDVEGTQEEITLTPEEERVYEYTLRVTYKDKLSLEAKTKVYAMPTSYYGPWTPEGTGEIPTEEDIKELSKVDLSNKSFEVEGINTTSSQSFIFAYPTFLGELRGIRDANGFEYLWKEGAFSHTIVEVDGSQYNVYFLTTPCKLSDFKFIFQ